MTDCVRIECALRKNGVHVRNLVCQSNYIINFSKMLRHKLVQKFLRAHPVSRSYLSIIPTPYYAFYNHTRAPFKISTMLHHSKQALAAFCISVGC